MTDRYHDDVRDAGLGGYYARDPRRGPEVSYRGRGPKNYRRSDELIADDIHAMLTEDDDLDATDIEVKVENGEVMLSGSVSNRWAKRHAEDLAAECPGVADVQNRLRVARIEDQVIGKASE